MLRATITTEAKGIADLHTRLLKIAQSDGAPQEELLFAKYTPIQIRFTWSEYLRGVVGAR